MEVDRLGLEAPLGVQTRVGRVAAARPLQADLGIEVEQDRDVGVGNL